MLSKQANTAYEEECAEGDASCYRRKAFFHRDPPINASLTNRKDSGLLAFTPQTSREKSRNQCPNVRFRVRGRKTACTAQQLVAQHALNQPNDSGTKRLWHDLLRQLAAIGYFLKDSVEDFDELLIALS